MRFSSTLFLLAVVAAAPLAGCQFLENGNSLAGYRADLTRLEAQIVSAIGEARADDVASCQAITYGNKACGGPSRARVYSLTDGRPDRVETLAARYTTLETEMNVRFNLASDCAYLMAPTPALQGGRCVAGPPSQF